MSASDLRRFNGLRLDETLDSGRTVIVYAEIAEEDPALESRLLGLLSPPERDSAARFVFARHRWTYVAAHALLHRCLEAVIRRPACFAQGPFGKPELLRRDGEPALRFSLSHTKDLVAVALCLEHEIGVDAEAIDLGLDGLPLAERFFSAQETDGLARLRDDDRARQFFAIWTMKEAVAKAVGLGLALPLDSFTVTPAPLHVAFHGEPAEDGERWWFDRRMLPGHSLAVAVRHQSERMEIREKALWRAVKPAELA
jgi:4'-phosphopantetheinyl transferase